MLHRQIQRISLHTEKNKTKHNKLELSFSVSECTTQHIKELKLIPFILWYFSFLQDVGKSLRPDQRTKAIQRQPWHHALNYYTYMQLWSLSCQHLCNQQPLVMQSQKIQYAWIFQNVDPLWGCMNQISQTITSSF